MSNALIFIFVLGGLVVVHEWGHFIVARLVGIRCERFSIGFGPVIFAKKWGETEYCISLLPLGGFVKLAGESAEEATGKPWEFESKALWQKFLVVLAGPFMNAFLAFVIFSVVFCVGQPMLTTKIGKIMDNTPAQSAGLKSGDVIKSVNGVSVTEWTQVLETIHKSEGDIAFTIDRTGNSVEVKATPRRESLRDLFGKKRNVAFVGIAPSSEMAYVKNPLLKAIGMGFDRVWTLTVMIFYSLGMMITGAMPFKESVTGPIGIFFMTQQAAAAGAISLFYFMASLSVSLFVLNLLPIPVLDGGHILFVVIEKLKGSPIKAVIKERVTQGGMMALLALMAVVILQDVQKFSIIEHVLKLFHR